jgi:uncharacterized protein (TIGR02444 family)
MPGTGLKKLGAAALPAEAGAATSAQKSDKKRSRRNLDAECWAFMLKIYQQPRVAECCLALQAEAGVDVIILLFAAFAAVRHRVLLKPSDLAEIDGICALWREQVVHALRALRVALKQGPAPAPNPATERLRSKIKASELAAERIQNDQLVDYLRQKAPQHPPATPENVRAILRSVVQLALQRSGGGHLVTHLAAIDEIAQAADRLSEVLL